MSSQIDFIQYKFKHYKQYFISENRSKDALNHHELSEIAIQGKKTFWQVLLVFFRGGTLSKIPLRPVLMSV